jgi:ankyrin repeat protein
LEKLTEEVTAFNKNPENRTCLLLMSKSTNLNSALTTRRRVSVCTALHCAASRGHTDCIETLVTLCGAEVDVIDSNGCTALFYAVTLGHADSTQLLLNFGAEPNRQDRKGRT